MAFLIVLGVSKSDMVSAQGKGNPLQPGLVDRSFPMETTEEYTSELRKIPISCDGVVVDRLSGSLDVFCRMFGHYDPLNPNVFITQWMIHNYSGTLTGEKGEVFEIQGVKKIDSIDKIYTFHLNLKGNMGSHYIISASGTTSPYTFTIDKSVCN